MNNEYSVVASWRGEFDEAHIQKWAMDLRAQLRAPKVSLGLVFMTPHFFSHSPAVLEILRVHAQIPLLAGCSSSSLIANDQELEGGSGICLGLYSLPDAQLQVCRFGQEQVESNDSPEAWHRSLSAAPDRCNGWLVFADPFHLDCESWLRQWNAAYPGIPILGGLASGGSTEQLTQVYLNGEVLESGGVAIQFGGGIGLASMISQGCTPIGETWTITKTEGNLIHEIGNRPAYEVLVETFNRMPPSEQKKTQGNVLVGMATNEYLEDFHRGDFLIRNLIGADPRSGVLSVGAFPRRGQTMQFQRRDAEAATEDMSAMLDRTARSLAGARVYGACLCCCNGRGQSFFGAPHHDAKMVQKQFDNAAVAGFFCNGEIGPVGKSNFLHGYTAALALFVTKTS
jgi:small ligand-binding sensory domain FIST